MALEMRTKVNCQTSELNAKTSATELPKRESRKIAAAEKALAEVQ